MFDSTIHQQFIDRHNAVVDELKKEIVTAALRAVAPRRVLSDFGHARETFVDTVMSRARGLFEQVGKIGDELARAKNA